jgi:hypothetical protein
MTAPNSQVTPNQQSVTNDAALVLLGKSIGLNLGAAGDTQMTLAGPFTRFVPATVVTTNSQGVVNVATATVGVYTQQAQQGTAVLTTAALTGQTTNAFAYVRAATAAAAQVASSGQLWANVGTTVAGATCDLFVYGYVVG